MNRVQNSGIETWKYSQVRLVLAGFASTKLVFNYATQT